MTRLYPYAIAAVAIIAAVAAWTAWQRDDAADAVEDRILKENADAAVSGAEARLGVADCHARGELWQYDFETGLCRGAAPPPR